MNKKIKGIWIALISILILTIIMITIIKKLNLNAQVPQVKMNNIDLSLLKDGIYEGKCDAGLVKVVVLVEVKDHKIVDIIINEHQSGLGKMAEVIVGDIINKQSLDVDVVSGATVSSMAIKKAIEEALTNN